MSKKRNWPNHCGVGLKVEYNGSPVTIVDVKAGPMTFNPADLNKTEVEINGSLKLRVRYEGGHEEWSPPTDGKRFVAWAEKQRAALERTP